MAFFLVFCGKDPSSPTGRCVAVEVSRDTGGVLVVLSPAEGFTGLRVRIWTLSVVVTVVFSTRRSKFRGGPLLLCDPEGALRCGALLAES